LNHKLKYASTPTVAVNLQVLTATADHMMIVPGAALCNTQMF